MCGNLYNLLCTRETRVHKRKLLCAALALLLLLLGPVPAHGQLNGDSSDMEEQLDQQLDALGRGELMAEVPDDARAYLEDADLFDLSFSTLTELTPSTFFPTLWRMTLNTLTAPLRALGAMIAVILLCALLGSLRSTAAEGPLTGIFGAVSVLAILTAVASPIIDCIVRTTAVIREAALFMLAFIPMFSAAMTSAGQPVSGATYNLFLLGACQAVSQLVAQTLIPMMACYLALCVCGSFVPELRIDAVAAGIRSAVNWALGLVLTIFVALLSIQSLLSQSADSVTVKATKFLVSSMVPAVGNILTEAFGTAQGALRLLKTTVGAYGIVVALFTFLPTLLHVLVWYLVTRAVAAAGDMLGAGRVSKVLAACSHVLSVLIAAIFSFALLIIISTGIVMLAGLGTA